MASNDHVKGTQVGYTNYVAYRDPKALGQSRIGHLDLEKSSIIPLSFASGAPLSDLYQVIEIGESNIKPAGEPFALSSVELLAPIGGRDILAVGKNYFEHAIEFNTSGYDSSDVCLSSIPECPAHLGHCSFFAPLSSENFETLPPFLSNQMLTR